jgi:hypothetical protein
MLSPDLPTDARRTTRVMFVEKTCGKRSGTGKSEEGLHLAICGLPERPEAALAEALATREQRGVRVPVVTLLVRDRHDAEVIPAALAWLSSRGRQVIVRTRMVLPKPVVLALAEVQREQGSVVVELELAHHKPVLQRALLGPRADTAAALLLQAQHLETLGIPVVARLAPLLPGVHDQAGLGHKPGIETLLRNVEAAALRRVVIEIGELDANQLVALVRAQRELSGAGLLELGKAFGIDAMVMLGASQPEGEGPYRLKPRRAVALLASLEAWVRAVGLELPACGCRAHCALITPRSANAYEAGYESVLGRDLFAGITF